MTGSSPMDEIRSQYREAFAQHGVSTRSVMYEASRQKARYEALTRHVAGHESVLDYGCGLAHLKDHLERRIPVTYHGVDVLDEFVESCRTRHPDADFTVIDGHHDVTGSFDHVVVSGTFNIEYYDDPDRNRAYVQEALAHLWGRCRVSMSVDFMTSRVDFRQEGAFHPDPAEMLTWVQDKLTPRVRLDHSYLPYEYAIVAFRDVGRGESTSVYGAGVP